MRSTGSDHDALARSQAILEIYDLDVTYGASNVALQGVSLQIREATVTTVLGANGAGKTTLLRAVSGVSHRYGAVVRAGRMSWFGTNLLTQSTTSRVRHGIVLIPEGRRIFGKLTVGENLRVPIIQRRAYAEREAFVLDLFPVLRRYAKTRACLLSGGEQQMLAIARGLMTNPKLLMLDEPTLGLAPKLTQEILDLIVDIRQSGISILLIEQNVAAALSISDYSYILVNGRSVLEGQSSKLTDDDRIRRLYLGDETGLAEAYQRGAPHDVPAERPSTGFAMSKHVPHQRSRQTGHRPG